LHLLKEKWSDIGFIKKHLWINLSKGVAICVIFYTLAFVIEFLVLSFRGTPAHLEFYVTGFSLTDKVVIKKLQAEETTKSGIVLASASQEKPQVAEIIAVGPGGVVDGNEIKMQVAVGQKVIIRDYAGTNVKLDGEEYIIVRQDDIAAIVED